MLEVREILILYLASPWVTLTLILFWHFAVILLRRIRQVVPGPHIKLKGILDGDCCQMFSNFMNPFLGKVITLWGILYAISTMATAVVALPIIYLLTLLSDLFGDSRVNVVEPIRCFALTISMLSYHLTQTQPLLVLTDVFIPFACLPWIYCWSVAIYS